MSSTSKVIVDQPGGNSMLYLPLDKLMAAGAATTSTSPNATAPATVKQSDAEADTARELMRSRDRDSR